MRFEQYHVMKIRTQIPKVQNQPYDFATHIPAKTPKSEAIFLGKANLKTCQTFVIVRGRVAEISEGMKNMGNHHLDTEFEISRITDFLREHLRSAKSKGFVLGISGGIDSSVVASLCQKSVGAENVTGVLLFEDYHRTSNDYQDANYLIRMLKIRSVDLPLTPVVQILEQTLVSSNIKPSKIALAN